MPMTVVEGWTGDIPMVLRENGQRRDLTGATLELRLFDKNGSEISEAGSIAVSGDPTLGDAIYSPAVGDLLLDNSPMYARIQVTIGGQDTWHPSQNADVWTVISISGKLTT